MLLRLLSAAVAIGFAVALSGTASAEGARPVPPAGGHDVTKPAAMVQASEDVAAAKVSGLSPRTAVAPIRARTVAPIGGAAAAAPTLSREVFGFAKADSLGDPNVGYQTWNFSLLSDVAYFGIHVNADGTLVTTDSGWSVWQSSTASNFINAAHAAGVRVLLSLMMFDQTGMCQALGAGQTTIAAVQAQLKRRRRDRHRLRGHQRNLSRRCEPECEAGVLRAGGPESESRLPGHRHVRQLG